jgi:hypothetical protein
MRTLIGCDSLRLTAASETQWSLARNDALRSVAGSGIHSGVAIMDVLLRDMLCCRKVKNR